MKPSLCLKHAAVCVTDLKKSLDFFVQELGFVPYHTTDPDWAMVQSEGSTLSLVRVRVKNPTSMAGAMGSHPAHVGVVAKTVEAVEKLHVRLKAIQGLVVGTVESHRDGSRGFYFQDFDGNQFECIFIPFQGQSQKLDTAVVLVAHASQEAHWKQAVERLAVTVQRHAPGRRVVLVYLELGQPTLETVTQALYQDGLRKFEIMPVGFASAAQGANDIPLQVKACQHRFTDGTFTIRAALGEHAAVIEAMAAASLE
jgi:sirohydrochlorin ferrochelatase